MPLSAMSPLAKGVLRLISVIHSVAIEHKVDNKSDLIGYLHWCNFYFPSEILFFRALFRI